MEIIRIMMVDDHQIVREGLRRMLELEPDMQVVAEASNAEEAIAQAHTMNPDIILMDIKMPRVDGIELTRQLIKEMPGLKILILTLYDEYLSDAVGAGAVGYLHKDLKRGELVQAIRTAYEGRFPVYLNLEKDGLTKFAGPAGTQTVFSEREKSIMRLVAAGSPGKEIAQQLAISETTLRRTLRQVFNKLGARNSSEAVAEALKQQLI